jgi:hypothetical protein
MVGAIAGLFVLSRSRVVFSRASYEYEVWSLRSFGDWKINFDEPLIGAAQLELKSRKSLSHAKFSTGVAPS